MYSSMTLKVGQCTFGRHPLPENAGSGPQPPPLPHRIAATDRSELRGVRIRTFLNRSTNSFFDPLLGRPRSSSSFFNSTTRNSCKLFISMTPSTTIQNGERYLLNHISLKPYSTVEDPATTRARNVDSVHC